MDAKEAALKGLNNAFRNFKIDLEAIPEEAFGRCFGGKARNVADIVCEVNMVNDHICMTLRGEEAFDWPEGWIKAPEDLKGKSAVIAAFDKSKNGVIATIEGFSLDELSESHPSDHGDVTGLDQCRFMAIHMWYHGGQLNFIQTLLGDDAWHW